jgi:hypothetical protein
VPFDSAPCTDLLIPDQPNSRLYRLFQSGVGEKIYGAAKVAPSQLAGPLLDVLRNPAISIIAPFLVFVVLKLRWFYTRSARREGAGREVGLAYTKLAGKQRRELLKLYYQVEKLLRRKFGARRMPWQTVADYTRLPATGKPEVRGHLSWFTRAVWHAAYNPEELPSGLVEEVRARLNRLRAESRW